MGHSPGFEDARWLAEQILTWMYSGGELPQSAYFDLIGSRLGIARLRHLVGRNGPTRGLSLTVTAQALGDSNPERCDSNSLMNQALHADRIIEVRTGAVRSRLEKPQTVRRLTRVLLREARELKLEEPCPVLARHQWLLVSEESTQEEITFELVVILSNWRLLEPNEEDTKLFLHWLRHLWRQPNTFAKAADETLSFVFTNWVLPQDPRSFKSYAIRTMLGLFRKGASTPNNYSISSQEISEAMVRAEEQAERRSRGKGKRYYGGSVSISTLARISYKDPRRIYESVKNGDLPTVMIGSAKHVEWEIASAFVLQAAQEREILALRKELFSLGMHLEAIRKRIYRLRKIGASDGQIIENLKAKKKSIPQVTQS